MDLRGNLKPSVCPACFATHVETKSAPSVLLHYYYDLNTPNWLIQGSIIRLNPEEAFILESSTI